MLSGLWFCRMRVLGVGIFLAVGCCWTTPGGRCASTSAQWDFNGSLTSSTGGADLVPGASTPASVPGATFATASIGGQAAQVVAFTRGTFLRLTHGLGANAGGALLNQYTLLMDVMFPSRPTGWAVLWQTSANNGDDGDWFINPSGGIGISGNYGGTVSDGVWHRLGLVVDAVAGTYTAFVDGVQVQQNSGVTLDGRFALGPDALLFADENQENAAGYVNSVQLRAVAMTAEEVAALGGPAAGGIPVTVIPALRLLSPNGGERFPAGSTQTITWTATNPTGSVELDLYQGTNFYRVLARPPMQQSSYAWTIYARLGDSEDYRIQIRSVTFPTVNDFSDSPFAIQGSGSTPNPLFGQPLQLNGGFESMLANWQTVEGHPTALGLGDGHGLPNRGTRFMHGGINSPGDSILRQEIDLLAAGFTAADIQGGAALDAEVFLRNEYGANTFDDQVYLRVAYLNQAGTELSSDRCIVPGSSVWVSKPVTGLLPPDTRKLRVDIVGRHRRDPDNDSMADDVAVRLQAPPALGTPVLTKLPMLQDVRTDAMRLLWETDAIAWRPCEIGRAHV